MRKYLFLIILWIGCTIISQEVKGQIYKGNLPLIDENGQTKVYPAFSFTFLTSERLANRKGIPLQEGDMPQLNELFGMKKTYWNQTSYDLYPDRQGIFIESQTNEGKTYGYYISAKRYTYFDGVDRPYYTYRIPRKMRPQVKELIERYQQQLPDSIMPASHDYQKMNISTHPTGNCFFEPTKKMVYITFYTCVDSMKVVPIQYRFIDSKKWGIQVWRDIPIWNSYPYCGTDEKGNLMIKEFGKVVSLEDRQDSISLNILSQSIPKWNDMNNVERMKVLDKHFANYTSLIYKKYKD